MVGQAGGVGWRCRMEEEEEEVHRESHAALSDSGNVWC